MKKIIIAVLLLGVLLVPHLVLAQEQTQPYLNQAQHYSVFNRFIDNVKMFFSFGDKKVMMALDIREKELNSAIINIENEEDKKAEKNIERAQKKLQYVQKKVSKDIAEDVKINIDETINKLNMVENLPDSFETYILEEEKTQLIAELVIEVEDKEEQTLTREIIKNDKNGKKEVKIIIEKEEGEEEEGEGGGIQTKIMEIEEKIGEIDNQIKERTFAKETGESDINIEGNEKEIKTGSQNEIGMDTIVDDNVVDNFVDKNNVGDTNVKTGITVGPVTNQINNNIVHDATNIIENYSNNVIDQKNDVINNVIVTDDMTIDAGPVTDDSGGGDGSICCKKTKYGETRYHWDSKEDCLNPTNIKGEVINNDVCLSLGTAKLNEEDPESWGSIDGGVPEPCIEQGAYDDEACEKIMRKVPICCRKTIEGEVVYGLIPGDICISPYGDRVDDNFCLN